MATCKHNVETITVVEPVYKEVHEYVLTLNEDEVIFLRALLGSIGGTNEIRAINSTIWNALGGVPRYRIKTDSGFLGTLDCTNWSLTSVR